MHVSRKGFETSHLPVAPKRNNGDLAPYFTAWLYVGFLLWVTCVILSQALSSERVNRFIVVHSFVHSFTHSRRQQIFIKHLYASCRWWHWGLSDIMELRVVMGRRG